MDKNHFANILNLSVLRHLYDYMMENDIVDLTDTDDSYVTRHMARLDCFSRADVRTKHNDLAVKLGFEDKKL